MSGADPEYTPIESTREIIDTINATGFIALRGVKKIPYEDEKTIIFHREFLPYHANALKFTAFVDSRAVSEEVYYSIGGGFVVQEQDKDEKWQVQDKIFPFPIDRAEQLEAYCKESGQSISQIIFQNELALRTPGRIDSDLRNIWNTMLESMYTGCHTQGILPGGLNVRRRSFDMHQKLIKGQIYSNSQQWIDSIRGTRVRFREIFKWVSCWALAVNEVNASLGRVVTAPTNGSAGVIPAVLMYYLVIENHRADFEHIKRFLLVSGEIGSIFKKNATISAAMGGCQAEIGVSSAMAAAALTELLGGTPSQCLAAAEIAMEHHLGLTCDPVMGLVQVPCIERNSMGAIKAINAAELALDIDPDNALVSLDNVVDTMWKTAKDMRGNYKETSTGGLAVTVGLADC